MAIKKLTVTKKNIKK